MNIIYSPSIEARNVSHGIMMLYLFINRDETRRDKNVDSSIRIILFCSPYPHKHIMYLIMYNGQNKVSKVGFADDLIPRQLLFVKVYDIMMTYDYDDEK